VRERPSTLSILLIVALVLGLRLPLMADQPYTDEGIYAAAGYFDHLVWSGALQGAGWLQPREGHLGLYPLLTSWVHALPLQPFVALRLIDAGVAVGAALAFQRLLLAASGDRQGALVGAAFVVLAMNHALFINAGFKNSIMPALWLLALGLRWLVEAGDRGDNGGAHSRAVAGAAALMALAILLREFFLPFGAVLALYVAGRFGLRALVIFCACGIAVGAGVLGLELGLRGSGGALGLLQAYTAFSGAIEPAAQRHALAIDNALATARLLAPLLPLALIALAAPWLVRDRGIRGRTALIALGFGFTLCPLLEVLYKSAFPYHFSQFAIGLALLLALAWRPAIEALAALIGKPQAATSVAALLLALTGVALVPVYGRELSWQFARAATFAPVMLAQNWASPAAEQALYLRAARVVREAPAGATLMTEGFAAGLFPLTGRMPAAVGMGDISRIATRGDPAQRAAERERLLREPPGVFVVIKRGSADRPTLALSAELATRYAQQRMQPPGLPPYRGWSSEIRWNESPVR
jgi:hypothetical protein